MSIDLTSRSDKILLTLGSRLSEANANIHQALIAWQKLVDLEEKLSQARRELNETTNPNTQHRIDLLKGECNFAAGELQKFYDAIHERLPLATEALDVVIRRLDKDYGEVFRTQVLINQ